MIAIVCASTLRSPRCPASMPLPSQRNECSHMYQLGLWYGSERQLISPVPSPTLYGGSSPQEHVSFISIDTGTFESMPLKPGHSYVPVLATGVDGGGVAGVSTPGSGSSVDSGRLALTLVVGSGFGFELGV